MPTSRRQGSRRSGNVRRETESHQIERFLIAWRWTKTSTGKWWRMAFGTFHAQRAGQVQLEALRKALMLRRERIDERRGRLREAE